MTGICAASNAQSFLPPNMDFELGTTANWTYYAGKVATGHIFTLGAVSATPGLHSLMSGSGTDTYGGFPVVGNGLYSLKLAHDTIDNNADAASYNLHVPAGGSYTLVYHYAAVLQDPGHIPGELPVFDVSAVDSATGTAIPSSSLTLLPTSTGFVSSTIGTMVKYKSWSTGSINLAGYGGSIVTVKFTAAACGSAGHFGYGYIDVSDCIMSAYALPSGATTVGLAGPSDYSSYKWTDATTFSLALGTTKSVTLPAPTVTTKYAVICTPFAGHGTVDTFYTTVTVTPPSTLGTVSMNTANATISVSPNPTSGTVKIQWANQQTGKAEIAITDVTGRIVSKKVITLDAATGEKQIELSDLANGSYFVNVKSESINFSGRITVQK